ncbi:MAG TPA: hypothetical protein VN875_03340 [Candidatus Binatus sp.]|jgi:hypothetical protein|nr:hypothetical protein [Candidatus Binatus sp.]
MSKIRTAVTAAILLWMSLAFPNTQSAWAGDDKAVADKTADTAKKDSDTPKKDGDKTPSSTEVSKATSAPASAVEGEIQQLREALSEQQALLQTQQARIVQLENQLHVGQGQPVALASGTASGAAAIAGSASAAPTEASSSSGQPMSAAMAQPNPPQSGGTQKPGEPVPSPLSWKLGAAEFTPGGWADIMGIFRTSDIGSGTGTTFGSIPFNNQEPQAGLTEFRATAQTSRLSLKVEANVNDATSVLGYVESDFNGYQPPNAYTSTNSGTFRLRLAFADIKHNNWEFIGGQTWSLLTPNRVGLSSMPQDVFTGYRLDTNYLAGLAYARQAAFRVIYHATDWWSFAVALENPQQYAPSSVVFPSTFFSGQFDNGSGASNGTAAASNPAIPNLHPDVIVKSAFDWKLGDHALHLEAAGLIRSFKVFNNLATPSDTNSITEGSGSLNANLEVFRNFRLIASTIYGAGNGRYLGALGPDAIVKADGELSPIHSGSGVAGFEYQMTPRFEFDGYYSGAYFQRNFGGAVASTATPAPSCLGVSGFFCTGFGFPGSANTNNKSFQEATFGITKTIWGTPNHGKLQFITQSSWVERTPWSVSGSAPRNAHAFLQYIDLRYVLP